MKQAYAVSGGTLSGSAGAILWGAPPRQSVLSRVVRFPLDLLTAAMRLALRLFKWLVLLPVAIVLALFVWFSVRLIRG